MPSAVSSHSQGSSPSSKEPLFQSQHLPLKAGSPPVAIRKRKEPLFRSEPYQKAVNKVLFDSSRLSKPTTD